ncbi:MAG: hypothetical protein M0Q88_07050 [Bacilli bacterium]|nr:hypothetical protein [Bacilli bacterium]
MKKLIFLGMLFFICSNFIFGQFDPPKGHTKYYGFRLYEQGARPGADSINQNYVDIDQALNDLQIYLSEYFRLEADSILYPSDAFFAKIDSLSQSSVSVLNSSSLTADSTYSIVPVTYTESGGAVTITLPPASTMYDATTGIGKSITIKDAGGNASVNNITINRAESDVIITDVTNATSVTISTDGESVKFIAISDTQWVKL